MAKNLNSPNRSYQIFVESMRYRREICDKAIKIRVSSRSKAGHESAPLHNWHGLHNNIQNPNERGILLTIPCMFQIGHVLIQLILKDRLPSKH